MTAEIKTFPEPKDLVTFLQDKYDNGSTVLKVTVLQKSVYLIQDESP